MQDTGGVAAGSVPEGGSCRAAGAAGERDPLPVRPSLNPHPYCRVETPPTHPACCPRPSFG